MRLALTALVALATAGAAAQDGVSQDGASVTEGDAPEEAESSTAAPIGPHAIPGFGSGAPEPPQREGRRVPATAPVSPEWPGRGHRSLLQGRSVPAARRSPGEADRLGAQLGAAPRLDHRDRRTADPR